MGTKVLGIDLGTTNSVVAIIEDGQPRIIPVEGERLLPSVVGVGPDGKILVGRHAYNQWGATPERTVRSVKRLMGSGQSVDMGERSFTPQEISAMILDRLRHVAQSHLGEEIRRVVITVPAYFNEPQRQATIEAGEIAGLQVERILNEPTAAALAYGFGRDNGGKPLKVLVYDLGGGTFDVSIIELDGEIVDVIATAGNNHLGGDDFDLLLADRLADEFEEAHQIDLRQDHQAWARLQRAAEEAKIELSSAPYATVNLEYIASDAKNHPLHIQREIERHEFEDLIRDLLDGTLTAIDQTLADAKIQAEDLDRVLLVGGSTRIPRVWALIVEHLGQEPHGEIDPDAAVALGAAVQAGIISGEEIDAILVDVTPFSLGIETATFERSGRIRTDHFVPLIRRNTAVPVQKSEVFSTLFPSQDAIHVKVYQGEHRAASQNVLLGDFMFDELKPNRPDMLTDVTVNFQLDINGILNVTVIDRVGRKQVTEQMKASRQRLSPEEIAKSQARLSEAYAGDKDVEEEVAYDPGVSALLDRAARVLSDGEINEALAEEIAETVNAIQVAAANGDDEVVEDYCDELIDLLFEAEE